MCSLGDGVGRRNKAALRVTFAGVQLQVQRGKLRIAMVVVDKMGRAIVDVTSPMLEALPLTPVC